MEAGFTRDECLGLYLAELPHIVRAVQLRWIDRAREQVWLMSLVTADSNAYKEALRQLQREETKLGRRLLSAMEATTDPKVRKRLEKLHARLKDKKDSSFTQAREEAEDRS